MFVAFKHFCSYQVIRLSRRKSDNKYLYLYLRTITQLCQAMSSQLRHVLTIAKKLVKQKYHLHMSSQYGERNVGPLTAEISW